MSSWFCELRSNAKHQTMETISFIRERAYTFMYEQECIRMLSHECVFVCNAPHAHFSFTIKSTWEEKENIYYSLSSSSYVYYVAYTFSFFFFFFNIHRTNVNAKRKIKNRSCNMLKRPEQNCTIHMFGKYHPVWTISFTAFDEWYCMMNFLFISWISVCNTNI